LEVGELLGAGVSGLARPRSEDLAGGAFAGGLLADAVADVAGGVDGGDAQLRGGGDGVGPRPEEEEIFVEAVDGGLVWSALQNVRYGEGNFFKVQGARRELVGTNDRRATQKFGKRPLP